MTDGHLVALKSLLKDPANKWLEGSLSPIVETDENGLISIFSPVQAMTMGLVFFFQSLMIEQRLSHMDDFLRSKGVIK